MTLCQQLLIIWITAVYVLWEDVWMCVDPWRGDEGCPKLRVDDSFSFSNDHGQSQSIIHDLISEQWCALVVNVESCLDQGKKNVSHTMLYQLQCGHPWTVKLASRSCYNWVNIEYTAEQLRIAKGNRWIMWIQALDKYGSFVCVGWERIVIKTGI